MPLAQAELVNAAPGAKLLLAGVLTGLCGEFAEKCVSFHLPKPRQDSKFAVKLEAEPSPGPALCEIDVPGHEGENVGRPLSRCLHTDERIQENGIGAGDVSVLGEDHGVPIDPLSSQRIEVIRGQRRCGGARNP